MIQINERGGHISDNVLDNLLSFNSTSTWSAVGTGYGAVDTNIFFEGKGSLKIENTAYKTIDLTVNNTTQSTVVKLDGTYDLSLYLRKSLAEDVSVTVEVYKNGASLYSTPFTFAEAQVDQWFSFCTNENWSFSKGDIIAFKFKINQNASSSVTNAVLHIDGMHLYNKQRNQLEAPIYQKPIDSDLLTQLKNEKGYGFYVDSLATPTITIGTSWTQITIDALGSNVVDCLPLEIRGISNLLTGNNITPIASGDDYGGRLDLTVNSKTGSPTYLEVIIDYAGSTPDTLRAFTGYLQEAKTPPFKQSLSLDFFTKDLFKTNGGKIYARTDAGSFTIGNRAIKLSRKSKRFV